MWLIYVESLLWVCHTPLQVPGEPIDKKKCVYTCTQGQIWGQRGGGGSFRGL